MKLPDELEPPSHEELLAMLAEIDCELRKEGLEIPQRPLHAVRLVSKRMTISLPLVPLRATQTASEAKVSEVVRQIHAWYEYKYGSRLNLDPSPGWFAWLACEEPWRVRIPILLAGVVAVAIRKPDVKSAPKGFGLSDGRPGLINIFDLVKDLPLAARLHCSDTEQQHLQFLFGVAYELARNLHRAKGFGMIGSAVGDLTSAVGRLFLQPKDTGGSRWATLQFVEKLIKTFVLVRGGTTQRQGHDLLRYARQAEDLRLPSFPREIYQTIQCGSEVRYGEVPSSLEEAIDAHYASLRLGHALVRSILQATELGARD